MILPMTCAVKAASSGSWSSASTRTFMAYQIAQPRPRAQVAESTGRQLGGQDRQPALLLANGRRVLLRTRQPDQHLSAQAECRVVPATGLDRPDRQARPPRELRSDQPRHQIRGDIGLPHEQIVAAAGLGNHRFIARPAALGSSPDVPTGAERRGPGKQRNCRQFTRLSPRAGGHSVEACHTTPSRAAGRQTSQAAQPHQSGSACSRHSACWSTVRRRPARS
jgi:hypothetical protein